MPVGSLPLRMCQYEHRRVSSLSVFWLSHSSILCGTIVTIRIRGVVVRLDQAVVVANLERIGKMRWTLDIEAGGTWLETLFWVRSLDRI